MSITIDTLSARVELMEKQIAAFITNDNHKTAHKKKDKKTKSHSDDHNPKTKKVSGYILFSKAMRENATEKLRSKIDDDHAKIKSTDIMKELARMWNELSEEHKQPWNTQANQQKDITLD